MRKNNRTSKEIEFFKYLHDDLKAKYKNIEITRIDCLDNIFYNLLLSNNQKCITLDELQGYNDVIIQSIEYFTLKHFSDNLTEEFKSSWIIKNIDSDKLKRIIKEEVLLTQHHNDYIEISIYPNVYLDNLDNWLINLADACEQQKYNKNLNHTHSKKDHKHLNNYFILFFAILISLIIIFLYVDMHNLNNTKVYSSSVKSSSKNKKQSINPTTKIKNDENKGESEEIQTTKEQGTNDDDPKNNEEEKNINDDDEDEMERKEEDDDIKHKKFVGGGGESSWLNWLLNYKSKSTKIN